MLWLYLLLCLPIGEHRAVVARHRVLQHGCAEVVVDLVRGRGRGRGRVRAGARVGLGFEGVAVDHLLANILRAVLRAARHLWRGDN